MLGKLLDGWTGIGPVGNVEGGCAVALRAMIKEQNTAIAKTLPAVLVR